MERSVIVLALLALLILGTLPQVAAAHGGLSIDEDKCKLKIGPYAMHFTGYQPSSNGSREFCEDIPQTGQTIIVMDMVDDVLREMPVEVRIIRDTGDETQLDAITLFHLPPKRYPAGSIPLEYNFDQAGKYIGLVIAGDKRQHLSRFPFSVGVENTTYGRYLLIILAPLLGFVLYLYSARVRKRIGQNDAERQQD